MIRKKEKGQLIVLSGPSGVGKSTVIAGEPLDDKPVSIAIQEVADGKLDERLEQVG